MGLTEIRGVEKKKPRPHGGVPATRLTATAPMDVSVFVWVLCMWVLLFLFGNAVVFHYYRQRARKAALGWDEFFSRISFSHLYTLRASGELWRPRVKPGRISWCSGLILFPAERCVLLHWTVHCSDTPEGFMKHMIWPVFLTCAALDTANIKHVCFFLWNRSKQSGWQFSGECLKSFYLFNCYVALPP